MDRLKDHKETKVDETQDEAGQIRPGPGQEHVAGSPPLLLPGCGWQAISLQQSTGMERHQLDPIHSATCWCAEGMWSLGQDQRAHEWERTFRSLAVMFPLAGGMAERMPPGTHTQACEGQGGGKVGEGWAAMVGGSH